MILICADRLARLSGQHWGLCQPGGNLKQRAVNIEPGGHVCFSELLWELLDRGRAARVSIESAAVSRSGVTAGGGGGRGD